MVSLPSCSTQFICTWMWDCPVCQLPPHQVCQPPPCHESSPPGCPSPPLLPVWMNVSSSTLGMSVFHTVQFSVSSGCCLFLNFLLSFFWLCEEAQCIYLCFHLGWRSCFLFNSWAEITRINFLLKEKRGEKRGTAGWRYDEPLWNLHLTVTQVPQGCLPKQAFEFFVLFSQPGVSCSD